MGYVNPVLGLALAAGLAAGACAGGRQPVVVFAAVSLTEPLAAIAGEFEREAGIRPVLNLGPSNALARQTVRARIVDVFVSADVEQMRIVEDAGLVEAGDRVDLLANTLVVVAPPDRAAAIRRARDLLHPAVARIAIGDPEAVPAGAYARRYLEAAGLWQEVRPRLVPVASVRAALAAADAGNADAAFVYRTDAHIARRARIAFEIDGALAPSIVYPAAVIRNAPNRDGARRFLAFLQGPAARRIFERAGFLVLAPARSGP